MTIFKFILALVTQLQLVKCATAHEAELPVSNACLMQTNALQSAKHRKRVTEETEAAPGGEEYQNRREKRDAVCISDYRSALEEIKEGLGSTVPDDNFKVVNVSEKEMLIGAGFGTTGTTSTAAAIKKLLGPKVSHCCDTPKVTNILAPPFWWNLMAYGTPERGMTDAETQDCLKQVSEFDYTYLEPHVDAIFDTPVAETFLYLWKSFPNSKVILTLRNSSDWTNHRSLSHKFDSFLPVQNPCGQLFAYPFHFSHEEYEKMFDLHADLVRCMVPKDRLLEMNLFEMSEKDEHQIVSTTADFLKVAIPDDMSPTAFPKVMPR